MLISAQTYVPVILSCSPYIVWIHSPRISSFCLAEEVLMWFNAIILNSHSLWGYDLCGIECRVAFLGR